MEPILHCSNCGTDIEIPLLPARPFHVKGDDIVCFTSSFFYMELEIVQPKKYTVIMNDGIGPGRYEPEKPHNANQADSLSEARDMFRQWLRDSGNDYRRADGFGQPWCDVMPTESWDGISYGDYPWAARYERGPLGGIVAQSL